MSNNQKTIPKSSVITDEFIATANSIEDMTHKIIDRNHTLQTRVLVLLITNIITLGLLAYGV